MRSVLAHTRLYGTYYGIFAERIVLDRTIKNVDVLRLEILLKHQKNLFVNSMPYIVGIAK